MPDVPQMLDLEALLTAAASPLGLRRRDDIVEPGWTFWELRSVNRHRVVALGRDLVAASPTNLVAQVRAVIPRHIHRAWWRGLAFGVVVEIQPVSWSPRDLVSLVDSYENRDGVLQWLVAVEPAAGRAIGVHTWAAVFLSPVYSEVMAALEGAGLSVTRAVKDKGGVWRFLTGVSALEGVDIPDFRDPSPQG